MSFVASGRWLAMLMHLIFLAALAHHSKVWSAPAGIGPTVKEVVEFTRILQPSNHDNDALQSQVSPDGRRAFVVTRKADVATDRNRIEVLLLDTNARHLEARRVRGPVRLLTVDAQRDEDNGNPALRDARWVDDRTLVFRARIDDAPFQAYRFDVPTRRLTRLTTEPLGVLGFDVSKDLRRVVYVAPVPNPAMPPGERSVVAGTNSFWTMHFGQNDLGVQQRRYRYMVTTAGSRQAARQLGDSFPNANGGPPSVSVSPDGRWTVLPRFESARQLAWSEQYPMIAEATQEYGPSVKFDPLGYFSRPMLYVPRRLVAYRLDDGREQVILDAPDDSLAGARRDRLWQGSGTSIVIAGTFLPKSPSDALVSPGSHLVEYWPATGEWRDIAALTQRLTTTLTVAGRSDAFVAVDGDRRRGFERGPAGTWREVDVGSIGGDHAPTGWQLRVQEALNQPPDIVAVGPRDQVVRLTTLNPQFSSATWGTMREFAWSDGKGRTWNGGLMVPAGFEAARRYPLVIQTYGFSPSRFYRDGANISEGYTSGFAGRAFLREGILVLAMPVSASTGYPADPHERLLAFSDGARGAIDALVEKGWVDKDRIGIMGWSATGARVLNLVTFGDAPIRAATMLDGDANTLFSMTITYAFADGTQLDKERTNQGGPYGGTLDRWVRNDPSLHTDCIRAALRFETYGAETHNNWDVYALLRRQYRPVEMIMFPYGSHSLARPSERMISIQGNVDWYRFWLSGEKRTQLLLASETTKTLKDQYARWSQMTELKQAADGKPACVRPSGE